MKPFVDEVFPFQTSGVLSPSSSFFRLSESRSFRIPQQCCIHTCIDEVNGELLDYLRKDGQTGGAVLVVPAEGGSPLP